MAKSNGKKPVKTYQIVASMFAVQAVFVGFLVYLVSSSNPLSGLLWGIGIVIVLDAVGAVGYLCWEQIKEKADEGRLLPYMLIALLIAGAVSGIVAVNLGKPSCDQQGDAPYNSCVSYANDGFEATSAQRWHKFWAALPVVTIICLLLAYIAHDQVEKNRTKHFESIDDGFSVGIFPEKIGTANIIKSEDGNNYKYSHYEGIQYSVYVTSLDEPLNGQDQIHKTITSWHKSVVSAATGINVNNVESSDGEKQHTPYVYGSYPIKNDIIYYHLTLTKYGKIYSLSMYIQKRYDDPKIFIKFVDSFRLIKQQ